MDNHANHIDKIDNDYQIFSADEDDNKPIKQIVQLDSSDILTLPEQPQLKINANMPIKTPRNANNSVSTLVDIIKAKMPTLNSEIADQRINSLENQSITQEKQSEIHKMYIKIITEKVKMLQNRLSILEKNDETLDNEIQTIKTQNETNKKSFEILEKQQETIKEKVKALQKHDETHDNEIKSSSKSNFNIRKAR